MKEKDRREKCVNEIMYHTASGLKLPDVMRVEIQSEDRSKRFMECNLPCDWSFGKDGHPVHKKCKHWDLTGKYCRYCKGIWYRVLINDCAVIWERKSKQSALALSVVLKDICKRNGIEFKSCFSSKSTERSG